MAVNWNNVTTWTQIMQTPNTNTGGLFYTILLFGIWLVVFILSSIFGFEVALLISSFFAIILGTFFVYAGLMAWQWLLSFIAFLLFGMLYISWVGNKK